MPGLADYCASKWGAMGFNESIRTELKKEGHTGVTTLCVCPYYINTGMFDGVQSRFPRILPILDPSYVVDRIISAIENDKVCPGGPVDVTADRRVLISEQRRSTLCRRSSICRASWPSTTLRERSFPCGCRIGSPTSWA